MSSALCCCCDSQCGGLQLQFWKTAVEASEQKCDQLEYEVSLEFVSARASVSHLCACLCLALAVSTCLSCLLSTLSVTVSLDLCLLVARSSSHCFCLSMCLPLNVSASHGGAQVAHSRSPKSKSPRDGAQELTYHQREQMLRRVFEMFDLDRCLHHTCPSLFLRYLFPLLVVNSFFSAYFSALFSFTPLFTLFSSLLIPLSSLLTLVSPDSCT